MARLKKLEIIAEVTGLDSNALRRTARILEDFGEYHHAALIGFSAREMLAVAEMMEVRV